MIRIAKTPGERIEMARFIYSYWRSMQRTAARKGWESDVVRYRNIADRWKQQVESMEIKQERAFGAYTNWDV